MLAQSLTSHCVSDFALWKALRGPVSDQKRFTVFSTHDQLTFRLAARRCRQEGARCRQESARCRQEGAREGLQPEVAAGAVVGQGLSSTLNLISFSRV